jgi:hypothetical protein
MPFIDSEYAPHSETLRCCDTRRIGQTEVEIPILLDLLSRPPEMAGCERLQSECASGNIVQQVQFRVYAKLRDNQIVDLAENRRRN